MGEIADDIVNGLQCSWCGVMFQEEHGYPVACKSCWEAETTKKGKKGWKPKQINGVQPAHLPEL